MHSALNRRSKIKTHDFFIIAVIALSGCAPDHAGIISAGKIIDSGALSICELAAHGLTEGLTVRLAATYKTDKSHYAYLSSKGCGKEGILNVGDLDPISEKSLKNFYDTVDQRCVMKDTPYVCVTEALLDADIKIIREQDGELSAVLLKINKFSFINP